MNATFEIGQKVQLRKDLVNGQNYDGITFWNEMEKALEKNNEIEALRKGKVYFKGNMFKYTESMLESI